MITGSKAEIHVFASQQYHTMKNVHKLEIPKTVEIANVDIQIGNRCCDQKVQAQRLRTPSAVKHNTITSGSQRLPRQASWRTCLPSKL